MIVFDDFVLDTEKEVLYRDGEVVGLPPKAVGVLCRLAERRGEVLTKDELMDAVWNDAFVEEANLAHQVYELRKYFKTHGKAYIETVSRRGYRFTGKAVVEPSELPATVAGVTLAEPPDVPRRSVPLIPALVIVAIIGIAVAIWYSPWRTTRSDETTPIRSIAVLPFKPAGSAVVGDGLRLRLADSLITRLGRLPEVSVRPTSSVTTYLRDGRGALETGRELNADVVIDGTISELNGKLDVTVQLFQVASGRSIWDERFVGDAGRLLELQDAISEKLSTHLSFRITSEQRDFLRRKPTSSSDAFEAFLRGRYLLSLRSEGDLVRAAAEFERAVVLDPNFALAFAGLGDCYALLSVYDERPPAEAFPKAREYARRALALDPKLGEAHATLGFIAYRYDWDWEGAEREFEAAIALRPDYATAHHWQGELFNALGRFSEGEAALRRALAIDPSSSVIKTDLGYGLYLAGKYDVAVAQFDRTIEADPNFALSYYCLSDAYAELGRADEAVAKFAIWMKKTGYDAIDADRLAAAYRDGGRESFESARLRWAAERDARQYFTKFDFARYAIAAGRRSEALDWLVKSADERAPDLIFIKVHPAFATLRDDSGFKLLLEKMRLN